MKRLVTLATLVLLSTTTALAQDDYKKQWAEWTKKA